MEIERGGDRLRRTAGVGVVSAEVAEGYLDFFFADFVALVGDVSGVSVEERRGGSVPCPGTFGVWFAMPAIDE